MKKTTKVTKTLTPAKKTTKTVRKTPTVPAVEVGFGNSLYLRGEGPGLSWDKGVRMECVSDDRWSIALGEAGRPFVFKFLINDETWSTGPDYTVSPGTTVTLTPSF